MQLRQPKMQLKCFAVNYSKNDFYNLVYETESTTSCMSVNNICYHRNKDQVENMYAAEMDFVSVVGLV